VKAAGRTMGIVLLLPHDARVRSGVRDTRDEGSAKTQHKSACSLVLQMERRGRGSWGRPRANGRVGRWRDGLVQGQELGAWGGGGGNDAGIETA